MINAPHAKIDIQTFKVMKGESLTVGKLLTVQKVQFLFYFFSLLGPVPPSGRRTKNGSLGQDIVWAGTFWRKTMKNQPGTMRNHEKP